MKRIFFAVILLMFFSVLAACSSNDVDTGEKDPDDTDTFTVTFETTGGTERAALQVLAGDTLEGLVENPTKDGFTFLGWSTSSEEIIYYDMSTIVTEAFTLYAVWSGAEEDGEEMCRLTVHLQGGAFRYVPVQTLYIDFKAGKLLKELPRMNTKPDHSTLEFAGWNTSPDGRGEIVTQDSELAGDLEIYAIYGELITTIDELKAMACNDTDVVYVIGNSEELASFLEEEEWAPLCSADQPFKGAIYRNFEDNSSSYPINLALTISETADHAGLFSYANGAIFNEITISGAITGADYAGFYAGEMKDTRVENIVRGNSRTAVYCSINGAQYGGLITGKGDNVTMLNVTSRANTSGGSLTGKYVGGIAGWLENSSLTNVSAIYVSPSGSEDGSCVGGITGYLKDSVMGVVNVLRLSAVEVSSDFDDSYVGVIAGYIEESEVRNVRTITLYSSAAANRDNSYAGVVAGGMQGGSISGARVASPVYAYGDNSAAGGVVGKNTGGSIADTIVRSTVYSQGGGNFAGGVAGISESGTISGNLVLSDSITGETAGAIVGSGDESGNVFVAGISVNGAFPAGGTAASDIRYNKDFFTATLLWDFTSIWEMKDYYDYPTFIFENAPDFIPITTAEELAAIGDSEKTLAQSYVLMNDLDLSTYNDGLWTPIGYDLMSSDGYFYGAFNGNGKTISNMKITDASAPDNGWVSDFTGLFKVIAGGGTVKDLTLANVDIEIWKTTVGALAGSFSTDGLIDPAIERVHVTGNVSGRMYIGGVIGQSFGGMAECSFVGNVSSTGQRVGGLVGTQSTDWTVSKSYSAGTVYVDNPDSLHYQIGGLVGGCNRYGSNVKTITSCYSTSTVTVIQGGNEIGGLVGSGTIIVDSYASGNMDVTHTYDARVGGVVGYLSRYGNASGNVALMSDITVDAGTPMVGRVVGDIYTRSSSPEMDATFSDNHAVSSLAATGTGADDASDVVIVDEAFFRSLGWDMDYLWIFDTDSQRPVFRWQ